MEAAAKLLDFSQPVDVPLLDGTVNFMYGAGTDVQRSAAEKLLLQFQEHPEAWTRVDAILEQSVNQPTKYFALQASGRVLTQRELRFLPSYDI